MREWLRVRRLRAAERALRDAVHYWDKWSFGHSPSQKDDEKENIYRLIRKVEKLGGDALDVVDYGFRYMCSKAMPDTFEQVRESYGNGWNTVRKMPEDLWEPERETTPSARRLWDPET